MTGLGVSSLMLHNSMELLLVQLSDEVTANYHRTAKDPIAECVHPMIDFVDVLEVATHGGFSHGRRDS